MNITISTAYFGPVQYYSNIYSARKVFLEGFEHYPKQTYRNRCFIYSANGPLTLSVPVTKGNVVKIYTKEIKIDYSYNWQKNHFKAIESAYRNSPYFEFYIDDLSPFYKKKFDFLFDFNTELLIKTCELIGFSVDIKPTLEFHKTLPFDIIDLRFIKYPKKPEEFINVNNYPNYRQVFNEKSGFIGNLSIIDLLFNTGPDALNYLISEKKAAPFGTAQP